MMSAGPLTVPAGLFAQLRFDPLLMLYGVLLIILIVGGCIAVVRVRRWRFEEEAPAAIEDQIKNYQALVERGEMDPQEYERLKAYLEQKAAQPPPDAPP